MVYICARVDKEKYLKKMSFSYLNKSPFECIKHPDISFPLDSFETLLLDIGWDASDWINFWLTHNGKNLAASSLASGTKLDWIWGLALPLLSDVMRSALDKNKRTLFGISALPGCGKTSLGNWLEDAAKLFNLSVKVVSIDDFYLPAKELDIAMKGNPWCVPRGLPGSHSIELLEESVDNWFASGFLKAPKFDKALRNGLGDRYGCTECNPDVLILEGWFLGCEPIESSLNKDLISRKIKPKLTNEEKMYREKVQLLLLKYLSTWQKINRIWHIKSNNLTSSLEWKVQQEMHMMETRGASLTGDSLNSFLRMIQCAIPQQSLMEIKSDIVIEIDKSRKIINTYLSST